MIKATAINNDGASKAGYLAPSVTGQAEAIVEAQTLAGVAADTLQYVECHGTGTYIGDPIEVEALTHALSRCRGASRWIPSLHKLSMARRAHSRPVANSRRRRGTALTMLSASSAGRSGGSPLKGASATAIRESSSMAK